MKMECHTVVVEETNAGTTTDFDGNYQISGTGQTPRGSLAMIVSQKMNHSFSPLLANELVYLRFEWSKDRNRKN